MHHRQKNIEIAERRQKVAHLYLRGLTQIAISFEVGVTQAQVSRDLTTIQQWWKDKAIEDTEKRKAVELAKIDELEREYWEAWKRSLEGFKSKTVKGKKSKTGTDAEDIVQTLKEEERNGDPRFLDGVMSCIEKRLKIFGLEAPTKITHTDITGKYPYNPLSNDELRKRFWAIVESNGTNGADRSGA